MTMLNIQLTLTRTRAPILLRGSAARAMTSAYSGTPGDGTLGIQNLPHLPVQATLLKGRKVEVGPFRKEEWIPGMELMNLIIREGRSWPFEEEFGDETSFRSYFLSHTALVVRSTEKGVDSQGNACPKGDLMGMFYIKPNYPGRCSHICNGGFITSPKYRREGVARLMGHVFLQSARDLGYKSAYFNLVFQSNKASVALWESLGFKRVALLEDAARLKGLLYLDNAFGYRYDLTTVPRNYLTNVLRNEFSCL